MARVAVVRADGAFGQRMVAESLSRVHHVAAVVRDPARLDGDSAVAAADEIENPQHIGGRFTGEG